MSAQFRAGTPFDWWWHDSMPPHANAGAIRQDHSLWPVILRVYQIAYMLLACFCVALVIESSAMRLLYPEASLDPSILFDAAGLESDIMDLIVRSDRVLRSLDQYYVVIAERETYAQYPPVSLTRLIKGAVEEGRATRLMIQSQTIQLGDLIRQLGQPDMKIRCYASPCWYLEWYQVRCTISAFSSSLQFEAPVKTIVMAMGD